MKMTEELLWMWFITTFMNMKTVTLKRLFHIIILDVEEIIIFLMPQDVAMTLLAKERWLVKSSSFQIPL